MKGKFNNLRIKFIEPQTSDVVAKTLDVLANQFRELNQSSVPSARIEKDGFRYFKCEKCGILVHIDYLKKHCCSTPKVKNNG